MNRCAGLLVLPFCLLVMASDDRDTSETADLNVQLEASTGRARIEVLIELAERLATQSFTQSREYGLEALELARAAGDSSQIGQALWCLSQAHFLARDYDQSLDYGLQALRVAESLNEPSFHARVLNSLGTIQQKLSRYDEAAELYEQALALSRSIEDRSGEARSLNSLGVNAWYEADYEKALSYYQQCLQVRREVGDRQGLAVALNNVAMIHHIREQYDEAIENYEDSLRVKREIGYSTGVAATLGNLGELYLSIERYPEALANLEQSRDLAAELNAGDTLMNSHYSLADYYEAVGDHGSALRNYRLASEQEKEIFSARNAAIIAEMKAKYDLEKNTLEIDRLNLVNAQATRDLAEHRQSRDRLRSYFVASILVVLTLAWLYRQKVLAHRRVRAQAQELELAAAKISALSQLLPICASCKKIKDEQDHWHQLESYLLTHAHLAFSHGICPGCAAAAHAEIDRA